MSSKPNKLLLVAAILDELIEAAVPTIGRKKATELKAQLAEVLSS